MKRSLRITVLSDRTSWLNDYLPSFLAACRKKGHRVRSIHHASELKTGDIAFFLSCGQIVPAAQLRLHHNNLVIHESALPKGRGWSPLTWQILEGKSRIPITLFEAQPALDSGPIYLAETLTFKGHELISELRDEQARRTFKLCLEFLARYPAILSKAQKQKGESSSYPRRTPADSRLDPRKSLAQQFNLLRVVDNERYPAYFKYREHEYRLRVEKTRVK
jgi:methionyl-tRNA formyltransferase